MNKMLVNKGLIKSRISPPNVVLGKVEFRFSVPSCYLFCNVQGVVCIYIILNLQFSPSKYDLIPLISAFLVASDSLSPSGSLYMVFLLCSICC